MLSASWEQIPPTFSQHALLKTTLSVFGVLGCLKSVSNIQHREPIKSLLPLDYHCLPSALDLSSESCSNKSPSLLKLYANLYSFDMMIIRQRAVS